MRSKFGKVLGSTLTLCLLVFQILALQTVAVGAEVSPEFSLPEAPAAGHYTVEYLPDLNRYDQRLADAYDHLSRFDFEPAYQLLTALIEDLDTPRPLVSEAWVYLGYIHLTERRLEAAEKAFSQALSLAPESAQAYYFLAQCQFVRGQTTEVIKTLEKAVELRPTFVTALRMLAESYAETSQHQESLATYERIVEILPKSGYYRFQLYRAYLVASRYADAERTLKKQVESGPGFDTNYVRLGDLYLAWYDAEAEPGLLPKAERAFSDLLQRTPSDIRAHLGLAKVALARRDAPAAERHLQKASALQPDNDELEDLRSQLERLVREARRRHLRNGALGLTGLLMLVGLTWSSRLARRRQTVLQALSKFNARAEKAFDFESFSEMLSDFFAEHLRAEKSLVLFYQPHDQSLQELGAVGEDRIRVVAGEGAPTQASAFDNGVASVQVLAKDNDFEKAFPSLLERLKSREFSHLLPLEEGGLLRGFVALGGAPRVGTELLLPLCRAVTQVLERLHLVEVTLLDEMTGLANRRAFNRCIKEEVRRAARYRQPCSLLLFDIDDFKVVNDTYGHPQGDRVLVELSELMKRSLRVGIDTAARIGGEEFAVVLPATPLDQAVATAERLRKLTADHKFPGFPEPHQITLSLGVGTYPDHARDERDLVKLVDEASYLAKRSGKDRVCPAGEAVTTSQELLSDSPGGLNILDRETGLYNSSYLGVRLADELRRSRRTRNPLSVMVVALDGFEKLPEKRKVMKTLSGLLKKNLREGIDLPSALRGHEIAILLPETELKNAFFVAERLRSKTEEVGGGITLSAGVSAFPTPVETDDPMALLQDAYRAYQTATREANSVFCSAAEEPTPPPSS